MDRRPLVCLRLHCRGEGAEPGLLATLRQPLLAAKLCREGRLRKKNLERETFNFQISPRRGIHCAAYLPDPSRQSQCWQPLPLLAEGFHCPPDSACESSELSSACWYQRPQSVSQPERETLKVITRFTLHIIKHRCLVMDRQ